jgi:cation:H+ antiporter
MLFLILSLLGGLVFLTLGAEGLVRGAASFAVRFGMPSLLVGLTLMAIGTSLPELSIGLKAALDGNNGLVLGNVVGSNILNILLILGLTAVVRKIRIERNALRQSGLVMLGVTVLAVVTLVMAPELTRLMGAAALVCLTFYYMWEYRLHVAQKRAEAMAGAEQNAIPTYPPFVAIAFMGAGFIGLVVGAKLMVDAAVGMAQMWGVSDTMIGLTVVSIGTTLPELTTSIMAALRKQSGLAVGNVIGSNIFNLLGVLGGTALIMPIPVDAALLSVDVWVMLAAAVALLVYGRSEWKLTRIEGGLFVAAYGLYTLYLIQQAQTVTPQTMLQLMPFVG